MGWMSTGHTRPLTESEVVESSKENVAIGGSSYACPRWRRTHFIAGHSHETPEDNGGVEHSHE